MDTFVTWLQSTALSKAIVYQLWIWPAAETVHFIGLTLVIGIVGFFDLRLIGFFSRIPVNAVRSLMPFALFGFFLNLVTGVIFLVGHPEQYVHNIAWWYKVGFLALVGLNALVFEVMFVNDVNRMVPGDDTPTGAKVIGTVSLIAWFGVLYWGRMLPFVGSAF
jgi:hypothetical protein